MKMTRPLRLFIPILAWLLTLAAGMAQAAVGNQITAISVAQGQDDSRVVKLSFKEDLAASPVHFTIANPHRIVLDFPQTANGLGRFGESVSQGVIKSYNVMQSGERTRVVLDLTGPAQYDVRQAGKHVLVAVKGEQVAEGEKAPAHFAPAVPSRGLAVRDVEFKRGKDGEGRIIVTLSEAGVGLDIKEQSRAIVVDFLNTALPASLQRKLDVADFATPVQLVETFTQGKNTRMKVTPGGKWDYSAYQMDNQFILELRNLDNVQAAAVDRPRYSGEKLSLNFQNVDVRAVLQVIADFTGLNIITSDTVSGSLTLRLKDVPWDQALDIILRAKGLDKRVSGNVIWVAPRDELAAKEKLELEAKQQIADLEDMQVDYIRLNYLRADEAQAILNGQSLTKSGPSGQAVSCETTATGIGGTTSAQTTSTGGGSTAQRILSKRGTTSFDLKTNTLFVQDTPSKIREAKSLLETVDVPSKQVMIEARVVIADDNFNRSLGAKLGFKGRTGGPNSTRAGISGSVSDANTGASGTSVSGTTPLNVNLPNSSNGTTGVGGAIGFSIIEAAGNAILNLELQALEADKRGKVLSNPRVITQNQKPAVILQGEEIPYTTVSNSGTQTTFRNAVLCLLVDPQVLNNDNIILDVEVTKDSRGEEAGTAGFAINKKRVKTQVRVKNGETAILGGIFEQTVRNDTNKVPFLGDLPFLGFFFRDSSKIDNKTELLIFLTPRVLDEAILFQ
ncbi:MAG TPA: type IV pilus secretin PilQ [Thiobacillaceae bacterium]|nr:type IV pilus secretin PilQ [Thiobacillaceae bacterium]